MKKAILAAALALSVSACAADQSGVVVRDAVSDAEATPYGLACHAGMSDTRVPATAQCLAWAARVFGGEAADYVGEQARFSELVGDVLVADGCPASAVTDDGLVTFRAGSKCESSYYGVLARMTNLGQAD